jgi:hypothetical protein
MPRQRNKESHALTRRDFARGIALTAATTVVVSRKTSAQIESASGGASQEATAQATQLSPTGEAQLQTILAKYGKRLSDEQKADVRRLVAQAQKTSEALHTFPLDNSDEPAMIFHAYRSDRR